MKKLTRDSNIGIMGGGTMGIGIALIAATNGHIVNLFEVSAKALENAKKEHKKFIKKSLENSF